MALLTQFTCVNAHQKRRPNICTGLNVARLVNALGHMISIYQHEYIRCRFEHIVTPYCCMGLITIWIDLMYVGEPWYFYICSILSDVMTIAISIILPSLWSTHVVLHVYSVVHMQDMGTLTRQHYMTGRDPGQYYCGCTVIRNVNMTYFADNMLLHVYVMV